MLGMDKIPPPISVRFTHEQLALLRAHAAAEDRPLSGMIRVRTMRGLVPAEPIRPAYTPPGPEVVFRSPVLAPETRQAITDTLSRSPPNRALDGSRATPAGKPMSKADQVRALREDKAR